MTNSLKITMSLAQQLGETGDDCTLQEVLDGVRDLVATLLVAERVMPDSFYAAVNLRVREFRQDTAEAWINTVGEA